MAQIVMHKEVLCRFFRLPRSVQKGVGEFIERFQRDSKDPALHVHPLKGTMQDKKVRGANLPEGYRAILIAPDKGDTFLLMHIDKHDDAYRWAQNKVFEVHPKTGVFQVVDVEELKEVSAPQKAAKRDLSAEGLFSAFSDEDLFQAGVPKLLIPSVRAIQDAEGLTVLSEYLPSECHDVLCCLKDGMALDEAIELALGRVSGETPPPLPASSGDFTNIQRSSAAHFRVVEGQRELEEILGRSLDEWRVFLHPSQRAIVEWNVKGPLCVTGAAGTGKTVAMLHRAVYLARRCSSKEDRILVTTFTSNLAPQLKSQLERLAPDVAARIEVVTLHALARQICQRSGWRGEIATDRMSEIWEDVWRQKKVTDETYKKEIKEEFEKVIDPQGIAEEDAYFSAVRSGLPKITREERRKRWPLFLAVRRELKARDLLTFDGSIHQAKEVVQREKKPLYRHVLVDEVQDFGLEALRFVRALAPTDEGIENPLSLFGDGHQRIYGTKLPMSRADIKVQGRSRRLRVNYRTTEKIREWAHGVLNGVEVDDLDGANASTAGDHCLLRGGAPEVKTVSSSVDEVATVVHWVEELIKYGIQPHEICIAPVDDQFIEGLREAGIQAFKLRPHEADPGEKEPGVRVATMQRIKGLEFRAVIMPCGSGNRRRYLRDSDTIGRKLCYVAATRARERLYVTEEG